MMVGKDGSFDLAGVAPGRYYLTITASEGRGQILGVKLVDVGKDEVNDVIVPAGILGDLKGSLKVEGKSSTTASGGQDSAAANLPASKFQIGLFTASGPTYSGQNAPVQDDGAFTVAGLGPAKYLVNVFGIPPGSYLKSVSMGDRNALEDGIDLTSGSVESPLQIVISQAAAQIDGAVAAD